MIAETDRLLLAVSAAVLGAREVVAIGELLKLRKPLRMVSELESNQDCIADYS